MESQLVPSSAIIVPQLVLRQPSHASFPYFNRLPAEIRLKIWETILPEPAVVERVWSNDKRRHVLRRKPPVILQVCRETRRWFSLAGDADDNVPGSRFGWVKSRNAEEDIGVWINWAVDDIWIRRGCKCMPTTD